VGTLVGAGCGFRAGDRPFSAWQRPCRAKFWIVRDVALAWHRARKSFDKFGEAQSFCDQGLAYLHSFMWIEAIRSFHQALRNDPDLAAAYWGWRMRTSDCRMWRRRWRWRRRKPSKKLNTESGWLVIREAEVAFLEDAGNPDGYVAYRKSVGDALKKNPNDAWLWIQRGLADEGSPFNHGQAGGVDTLAYYKTALAYAPENLPALHYYAHTCESIGRIKEALELTAIYARLAPAIPHAHHMHGHELLRSGRTEEAIQEFLKAKELGDHYHRVERIPAQYDWHHAHNLQLLARLINRLGR
jgi:tetratricopeptide (TPR) repeat protein